MEHRDTLVTCTRCNGNACYQQQINDEVTTWLCWGCGFTTSNLMKEKSEIVVNAYKTAPELYKDIKYKDKQGLVWLPATLTIPEKGMVFLDGTSNKDWRWAAVKAIPMQEGDVQMSSDQTHKMDMKNVKHFEQTDFMDAAEHIGMFDEPEK